MKTASEMRVKYEQAREVAHNLAREAAIQYVETTVMPIIEEAAAKRTSVNVLIPKGIDLDEAFAHLVKHGYKAYKVGCAWFEIIW